MLNRLRRRSSPYEDRLRMTGREWMHHLYGELSDDFEVDESREKFVLTYNPGGFLRRR